MATESASFRCRFEQRSSVTALSVSVVMVGTPASATGDIQSAAWFRSGAMGFYASVRLTASLKNSSSARTGRASE